MDQSELMTDEMQQRKQFAGRYVAWLDGRVILSATTDAELYDLLDQLPADQEARASVEYIDRIDVIRVY